MERLTGENQGSNIPARAEEGASSSVALVAVANRRMNVADDDGNLWTIFVPPTIGGSDKDLGAYSAYLGSLSVNSVSSSFSAADIPAFMEKYQIPPLVQIRVPEPWERACYYRPGEVCFYEAAFERGLRFPMDDHIKELLVALDLCPAQIPPNMWSCLVGTTLIFRAISAGSHNISAEEFVNLFQVKDGGGKNKGILSCSKRPSASTIIHSLPSSVSNWKRRFFFVSGSGWENQPSVIDSKTWFTDPTTICKFFIQVVFPSRFIVEYFTLTSSDLFLFQ